MHLNSIYFVNDHIFFFFNDTPTTEIYTLSLHDALPIWEAALDADRGERRPRDRLLVKGGRSEEHTSELQSRRDLVCRLLLEKKKRPMIMTIHTHGRIPGSLSVQPNETNVRATRACLFEA